jgi:hypothetical protein
MFSKRGTIAAMSFTLGFDATRLFIDQLPAGFQVAGYDSGGDGVAWALEDWDAHPGAIHIDQDPDASDTTADVLDCENGAVPVGSPKIPRWAKTAKASFAAVRRPGQRTPLLYQSASNVTANVNALVNGGVTSGVGLFIADWTGTSALGIAELATASGPFPLCGMQFKDDGDIDSDVWSTAWLENVSGAVPAGPPHGNWVYYPCQDVYADGGTTSVRATWSAPDGPPDAPAIGCYQVTVRYADGKQAGQDVNPTYPRIVAKTANPQAWEGGSLPENRKLLFLIRALTTAEGDGHGGNFVTAKFSTE